MNSRDQKCLQGVFPYCLIFVHASQRAAWTLTSGADAALVRDSSTPQLQTTFLRLEQNGVDDEGGTGVRRRFRRSIPCRHQTVQTN